MDEAAILIIEDDPAMLRGLKDNFQFAGYGVRTASDGEAGLKAILHEKPDLVILDIMLPGLNGYEICRSVREEGLLMPIIMLTAKGQESDIVLGLNIGANDYVTKPFRIKELLARANALLRSHHGSKEKTYAFGAFQLDLSSRKLLQDRKEVELTPKEFDLLAHLLTHRGRAMTRDQLLSAVWGYDVVVTHRSIDRCVNTLRAKIETDPRHPIHIKTVREIGYRFEES